MVREPNHAAYERGVTAYDRRQLHPVEATVFERLREEMRGQPILDLGCGTGRTTPHLRAISQDYTGGDYARAMVRAAQHNHPGATILELDARDLSRFAADHFALVVFSYNGIDYVDHAGRLRILREVHRVLRPGGAFLMSSHNLAVQPQRFELPGLSKRFPLDLARRVYNHARMRGKQERHPGYALLNDSGHDYALLTYYVDRQTQLDQLHAAGFPSTEVIGAATEPWLHYLTRKPI